MAHSETFAVASAASSRPMTLLQVWLFAMAALVLLMIAIGGATRLTGSGLSITEWKPIVGTIPPLSKADWLEAFDKYRQIPQYHHVNRGMSLDAFKSIFWWEWAHRNLARLIGVAFALPFLFFVVSGSMSRGLAAKLGGIFTLGGIQGLAGWYMVSSGLTDRIDVSQYRLTLHLGLAVVILGALVWVALSLSEDLNPKPISAGSRDLGADLITALVFCQVLLGALVAGLKAGHAYNSWPLMDGSLIPSGLGTMKPWYLNIFENAMTVQFNHRIMAYVLVIAVWWRTIAVLRVTLDRRMIASCVILCLGVSAQAALGVWTLLAQVPLALGIAHQALAAVVFALAVWHLFASRHPRDWAAR